MGIIWMGGEDIDFSAGAPVNVSTSPGEFRADYARCAISGSLAFNSAFCPIISVPFPDGPETSFWFSCRFHCGASAAVSMPMVGLMRSGIAHNPGLWLGASAASATRMALQKVAFTASAGAVLTELATEPGNSFGDNTLVKLDIQVTGYGAGVSTAKVWWNGTLIISYSGSLATTYASNLNCVAHTGNSGSTNTAISEVIVSTSDTRTLSLSTLPPDGPGDTTDFAGADSDVNELSVSDAAGISTNTTGLSQQFTLAVPAGSFYVRAVREAARAIATSGATATSLALGISSGGSIYPGTPQTIPSDGWTLAERIMALNPLTGRPFTPADLASLRMRLGS